MINSKKLLSGLAMIIMLVASTVFLSACGTPKTVPDKTIEWAVEDHIKSTFEPLGLKPSYTYSVTHTADSPTKSDTIHIDLALDDIHFSGTSSNDATYVFDKSSGLWSVTRGGVWSEVKVDQYKNVDLKKDTVTSILEKNGFIIDRDYVMEATLEELETESLPEGVVFSSAWAYIPPNEDLMFYQFSLEGENAGLKTIDVLKDEVYELYGLGVNVNQVRGSNYAITMANTIEDGSVFNARYGYVENYLFIFTVADESATIANSDERMNKTMADLGLPIF